MGESNGVGAKPMKHTSKTSSHVVPENCANGTVRGPTKHCFWFKEELEEDLQWVFGVSRYVFFVLISFLQVQATKSVVPFHPPHVLHVSIFTCKSSSLGL